MNINIWFATVLMALLCIGDANAATVSTKGLDLDDARVSRSISGTTSVYPVTDGEGKGIGGQRFDLVNVGIKSDLDVGCGGLDLKDVLKTYFKADYQNILDYLKANAMSYALTYLIYENPTLYSLLEQLKGSANFALNTQMVSCQGIREIADKKRKNNDYYADAKILCLQDGNTETQCSDDGKLEKYLKTAIENREGKLRAGTDSSGGANGGAASWNKFMVSNMGLSPKDKALVGKHTGDWLFKDGNVEKTPPISSLDKTYDDLIREYDPKVKKVFNLAKADPKPYERGKTSSPAAEALVAFNNEDGVYPISTDTVLRINALSKLDRSTALDRLTTLIALGKLKSMLRRELMIHLNGLQSPNTEKEGHEAEMKAVRENISDLKFQMQLIDDEFELVQAQGKFLTEVYDNASTAKPVIR